MSAIRDDGGVKSYPSAWRDALHFLESVRRRAAYLQLDRSEGQPTRLVLMCEAGGMVPQLATVAHPFGVPVLSSGGFDSVTEKHAFAEEIADEERIDHKTLRRVLAREKRVRKELIAKLK